MKHFLLFTVVLCLLSTCSKKNPVDSDRAGTVEDVHSGTITGNLLTKDGTTIDDTVTVLLYSMENSDSGLSKRLASGDSLIEAFLSTDGTYEFDSLNEGVYRMEVTKKEIIIGRKDDIRLEKDEKKNIDITITIIINQTFNIWNTDNSQNITINNFTIINGTVVKSDSGYILTTAETDTFTFDAEIEINGDTSNVTIRIIWKDDGSVTIDIVDGDEDDELIVTPDPNPPKGYIGTIDINITEPGLMEIETVFDTSGVPKKSR
ncbi:MAG: hypothetical protein JW863_10155 [Chitinispirillaceae bacterium]|nr:hypothetical protein [Chitinispirillaceae bacterium]